MVLKGDVKISGALRKLGKLQNQIIREGNATAQDMAELGKQKARSIAPYHSGRTHQFIRKRVKRVPNGALARVEAFNPTKSDGHRRNISNFNLVRWMHESPKAIKHIISGDREFMYTTRKFLNGIKGRVATGRYRNINLR